MKAKELEYKREKKVFQRDVQIWPSKVLERFPSKLSLKQPLGS